MADKLSALELLSRADAYLVKADQRAREEGNQDLANYARQARLELRLAGLIYPELNDNEDALR